MDWINKADPDSDVPAVSEEEANNEPNVYLLSEEDRELLEEWLSLNFLNIFETELHGWYNR